MSRLLPGHHLVGHIGVDSGQIMLTDPCYVDSFWKKEEFVHGEFDSVGPYPMSYPGACKATSAHTAALLEARTVDGRGFGLALATESGYGDGTYPVTVEVSEEGRVKSLTITFFVEDDDE